MIVDYKTVGQVNVVDNFNGAIKSVSEVIFANVFVFAQSSPLLDSSRYVNGSLQSKK